MTADNIKWGQPNSLLECPVALAILETGTSGPAVIRAEVGSEEIKVTVRGPHRKEEETVYRSSGRVREWLERLDAAPENRAAVRQFTLLLDGGTRTARDLGE